MPKDPYIDAIISALGSGIGDAVGGSLVGAALGTPFGPMGNVLGGAGGAVAGIIAGERLKSAGFVAAWLRHRRTRRTLIAKLITDFDGTLLNDPVRSADAVQKVKALLSEAELITDADSDPRLTSTLDWPFIIDSYNQDSYHRDLLTIHASCDGELVLSASSVSAASCLCLTLLAKDLSEHCGAVTRLDFLGRNGREHIDRIKTSGRHDFVVCLSDCLFLGDEDRNLPYRLMNVVTATRQRVYRKKTSRIIRSAAVFVSEQSTAELQALLKFGLPMNTEPKPLSTSGDIAAAANELAGGDYVCVWDPLWLVYDNNDNYDPVPGTEYDCFHGLFCHKSWNRPARKLAVQAFMRVFAAKWNCAQIALRLGVKVLTVDEVFFESFSQACGLHWSDSDLSLSCANNRMNRSGELRGI